MAAPTLIYSSAGNQRLMEIAVHAGFQPGAQLPGTVYFAPYFADQDWKKPDRDGYMQALAKHLPMMATVLDWEYPEQFAEVMNWAEEAARYVQQSIVIIPKVLTGIEAIPNCIGGKEVVIGYSIPTKHGATCLPIWELEGRKVHLLGGSPHRQMQEFQAMRAFCQVVSADGNMMQKLAIQYCAFWQREGSGKYGHWPKLSSNDGQRWDQDAPYEAFRRSCINIQQAWSAL